MIEIIAIDTPAGSRWPLPWAPPTTSTRTTRCRSIVPRTWARPTQPARPDRTCQQPSGLVAFYVTGYSAFRIFEESLRVDPSEHFLGLRLNMYVASALTLAGLAWFARTQVRPRQPASEPAPDPQKTPVTGP